MSSVSAMPLIQYLNMQLRHNVNSGHIRYAPVRNYAAMLKMSDTSEWARLFDSAE
ncbi:hypothetical protein OkiPb00119_19370 [Escherichia coli]